MSYQLSSYSCVETLLYNITHCAGAACPEMPAYRVAAIHFRELEIHAAAFLFHEVTPGNQNAVYDTTQAISTESYRVDYIDPT